MKLARCACLLLVSCVAPAAPADEIQATLQSHRTALRTCYEKRLQVKPALHGTIQTRFTIQEDGSVANARISESTLQDEEVQRCVLVELSALRFAPRPGEPKRIVVHPFTFGGDDSE